MLHAEDVGPHWVDSTNLNSVVTHIYSAQARTGYLSSRHSKPAFHSSNKEQLVEAADIRSNGGLLNRVNGREDITSFYCYWGDKQHWLMVEDFRPRHSGIYAVQALYSNGAGTRSTGIACCLKWLLIYCLSGGVHTLEAKHVIVMPQNSEHQWDIWSWSTAARVHLNRGAQYTVIICEHENPLLDSSSSSWQKLQLMNMSYLDHFTTYATDGHMLGGGEKVANYTNIARLRFLLLKEQHN